MVCKKCGCPSFSDKFYAKHRKVGTGVYQLRTCRGCRQTAKDEKKADIHGRMKDKVKGFLRRHAADFGMKTEDFCEQYGHSIPYWLHRLEHDYENSCPDCGKPYKTMPHGLASVTWDRIDPSKPPFKTNYRFSCSTCNSEKRESAPEDWGQIVTDWGKWRKWQENIKKDPTYGLPLFSGKLEKLKN